MPIALSHCWVWAGRDVASHPAWLPASRLSRHWAPPCRQVCYGIIFYDPVSRRPPQTTGRLGAVCFPQRGSLSWRLGCWMSGKKEGQKRAEGGDSTLWQAEREDAPELGRTTDGRGRKGWSHPHTSPIWHPSCGSLSSTRGPNTQRTRYLPAPQPCLRPLSSPWVARRESLRAGRTLPPWCPTSSSGRRGKRGSARATCPHSPRRARARPEAAFQVPRKGLSSCRRFAWTRNSTHPGCQEFTPISYWEARSALFRDFLHLFRSSRDTPYGDRAPLWMGEPREGGVSE